MNEKDEKIKMRMDAALVNYEQLDSLKQAIGHLLAGYMTYHSKVSSYVFDLATGTIISDTGTGLAIEQALSDMYGLEVKK